jgi:D-alanine-D-alanine ligase
MQGLLELMSLPYTGSDVKSSSLAMDKLKTKQIWLSMGLPTPDFCILDSEQSCTQALETLGLPLIIKPVLEGSSIGMSKVEVEDELVPAWEKAQQCGGTVIAERWIVGEEYTAAMLDDQVLPMIKLKTTHKFYDYDAKYEANDTQYICPCGLPEEREAELGEIGMQSFRCHRGVIMGTSRFYAGSGWSAVVDRSKYCSGDDKSFTGTDGSKTGWIII